MANSRDTALKNGTKTLKEIAAEDGVDEEARYAQRKKEWDRSQADGVPYPIPQGVSTSGTTQSQTEDDDGNETQDGDNPA